MSDKIQLYSVPTPNGIVVSILLEELKAVYGGPDYEAIKMSISDADIPKPEVHNQVKREWFLKINPNGRIPTITDTDGFSVFETSAILLYLAQKYDKDLKFSHDPKADPKGYSQELQWLFFAHGGIGPMQGQANHFNVYAPKAGHDLPYAKKRYLDETKRLYGVLEIQLQDKPYLLGTYGIADIKAFGWVTFADRLGIDLAEFPKVKQWVEAIKERPAVKIGINIPPWN
ncbi:glutathione S-transferase [Schizopora paradoxa]|uniref:Glutathione S-transferase n=1 Tax=Schizopora paradoxa TaxID=27342 RepID=A0A0H2RC86_9AGAM|nr:glutathione S-transferase [Schizopora paradoxa]